MIADSICDEVTEQEVHRVAETVRAETELQLLAGDIHKRLVMLYISYFGALGKVNCKDEGEEKWKRGAKEEGEKDV